ncbi:MAG TPA: PAS domain S-box protein [Rhizobiales bacterium]|nr:sensor protein FixL [bacterium BMS3Bbin10]HDO52231.1 PAS domain S-box protein [Hyphomicrobiales bacterium]
MGRSGPIQNQRHIARQRAIAYLSVGAGLVLGYALLRGADWRSSITLHTVMEVVATLLALTVAAIALVRFYSKKNNTFLFIGAGFLGTSLLDGYHAVVTSAAFKPFMPSDLPALSPWSWFAPRLFLSIFLFLSWLAWRRERQLGEAGRIGERSVYLFAGAFTALSFSFFAFLPLPRAYYPELAFHRPEELLPALFFLAALAGYLRKGDWRHDMFEHWLVLSLIVSLVGQAVFMSFSRELFDIEFDAAHLLKMVSYVCVLTGLLGSIYTAFRFEARRAEAMAKAKVAAEMALAELDQRDVDLIAQNERFNAALEHMSQGLSMFDREQRLIVCNQRYASMYGLSSEQTALGTTLRQILEHRIANGLYAGEDPEAYIQERMAWVTSGRRSTKIQERSDGRAIAITHQPMSGGGWLTTHEDVTEITQAQQIVQRQKEELDQILSNVPRAVVTIDSSGIIRTFNPAAEQTFGYPAGEAIGQNVSLLMPAQDRHHHDGYLRSYIETGVSKFIESGPRRLTGGRKDGTEFPMELALGVVGKGKDTGFIGVAKDITEELKVETRLIEHRDLLQKEVDLATADLNAKAEELKRALKKEQELNKLQRQFVAMASHEFRTPLSIIDGSAQFLSRNIEDITPDYLLSKTGKIRSAVARMTRLMESTLTVARLEEGKNTIEIGPCDIGKVVREVCALQHELTQTHVITCNLEGLPQTIQADPGSLEQIFTNLLSNAVKYAPHAPDIRVTARREGDHVAVQVCDRGLGIDEEDLPKVFERFFRAKTSTGIEGTGIGLNLTKSLVEMHGGTIEIRSEKDKGSIITVRLPVAGPEGAQQSDTRAA